MRAKDILLEALAAYTGTVVLVSHDRYFIDRLATRVFEVGDGEVEVYPGNYEDYLWRKQGGVATVPTLDDVPMRNSSRSGSHSVGNVTQPTNGGQSIEPVVASSESKGKRLNPIKRKQLEERVHEMEEDIARIEAAITHCETSLLTFVSAEESQRQNDELQRRRGELESLLQEWEELSQALEATS